MADQTNLESHPSKDLVERLLAAPDFDAQQSLLAEQRARLDEQTAERIKAASSQFLRSDVQRALRVAELVTLGGALARDPAIRALGLLAEANVYAIGLGDYRRAMELSAEAAALYQTLSRPVDRARACVPQLDCLARLGRYAEAVELGKEVCLVLEEHEAWRLLAIATMNLGAIHSRHGNDPQALAFFDRASVLYRRLGVEGSAYEAWVEQNRAISLRNLGRFEEAIAASSAAWQILSALGQEVEAARARQNLGMTYYVLGRYNEALENLDAVHEVFVGDGRWRDAMLVELFTSECLLKLRRFPQVIEKCRRVRTLFADMGVRLVAAQAIVNEAVAYTNLSRYEDALASLADARQVFVLEENAVWAAMADLEASAVLQKRGENAESEALALAAIEVFEEHALAVEAAEARIIAGLAALGLQAPERAAGYAQQVLAVAHAHNVPSLCYHGHQIMGRVAEAHGDRQTALGCLEAAIQELERLRGRMMVEYRADFVEDKQVVYEDAVRLCLALGDPALGLEYTERAKSRSLLDLIAYKLDLRVQAKRLEDDTLVTQLMALRSRRDHLYRRWESSDELKLRGWSGPDSTDVTAQQEILAIEQRITELWYQLLVRNADYAQDAALWCVRTEPIAEHLPADAALLEYFVVHDKVVVFVVSAAGVTAHELEASLAQVQQAMQLLQMNLSITPRSVPERVPALAENAKAILRRLHDLLLGPVRERLAGLRGLFIVPHGPLHYLPFHALHDGRAYLIEQWEVSYLPGASLLRYCRQAEVAEHGALVYGHSLGGRLPHTLREAASVGHILGQAAVLEDDLTPAALAQAVVGCRIIHLATHGDFRSDNPLFSGLVVGEGWLTTLDIFNLRLRASLVTLSACQTGRNVVRGGDELFGLMRAFLAAGCASIALTLWPVEDQSTAALMEHFYRGLAAGQSKGAALRGAQLSLLYGEPVTGESSAATIHPYYWAPFYLVGDPARL